MVVVFEVPIVDPQVVGLSRCAYHWELSYWPSAPEL